LASKLHRKDELLADKKSLGDGITSIVDDKTLYGWYSDENHKYNTLIWQVLGALVAANLLVVKEVFSLPELSPAVYLVPLAIWIINGLFLLTTAKHAYHQKAFTRSLNEIAKQWLKDQPGLPVVKIPPEDPYPWCVGWIFKLPAAWVLVGGLFLLNLPYLLIPLGKLLVYLWRLAAFQ
jgi:hypothetical protein